MSASTAPSPSLRVIYPTTWIWARSSPKFSRWILLCCIEKSWLEAFCVHDFRLTRPPLARFYDGSRGDFAGLCAGRPGSKRWVACLGSRWATEQLVFAGFTRILMRAENSMIKSMGPVFRAGKKAAGQERETGRITVRVFSRAKRRACPPLLSFMSNLGIPIANNFPGLRRSACRSERMRGVPDVHNPIYKCHRVIFGLNCPTFDAP